MALEQFVSTVRTLSGQGNFHELCEYLSKNGEPLLSRHLSNLDTVLETLDVQDHSLGVLSVLTVKLQHNASNANEWGDLYNSITSFIMDCNGEQIRYSPSSFCDFCRYFAEELLNRGTPICGILPLLKAITKIQLNEMSLTSIHSDLCKLCLSARCFSPVLPLLEIDYLDISKECSSDAKYILLFYYYGGMIYTAMKKFEKALYFFEVCVTVPSSVVSHIMLEAYKKYLLVSLLVANPNKDQQRLPKYTSPIISKFMKNLCASYHDIVNAYFIKAEDLQDILSRHSEIFNNECNLGLVNQVAGAQTKMNIKRLTKTFLTLSLEDVASRVSIHSSAEAERKLVEMIEEGLIQARISQKDGMVRFNSNPEHFDSVNMLHYLEKNINNCINLDKQILSMDDEIVLNPIFVRKSVITFREIGEGEEISNTSQSGVKSGGVSNTPNSAVSSGTKQPGYSM